MAAGMRAALERDGFVLIRGIVPPELLRDVQGVVEAAVEQRASDLLERGLVSSTHAGEPFETRWQAVVDESGAMQARRSWDEDLISPQFHRLCSAPALTDALQSMLGSDSSEGGATCYCTGNFSLRPKIPNDKRTTIKWHNDSMYSRNHDDLVLTCWLPLVPADEVNGCMQVRPPQGLDDPSRQFLAAHASRLGRYCRRVICSARSTATWTRSTRCSSRPRTSITTRCRRPSPSRWSPATPSSSPVR